MWVEKTFLKIGFLNGGVELQVILQSFSLVLGANMTGSGRDSVVNSV